MNELKEKNERKNQRKTRKENQQQQPRAREVKQVAVEFNPNAWDRGITCTALKETAEKMGMPIEEVNDWQRYMDITGWVFGSGSRVHGGNFRRSLRMWHKVAERIKKEEGEGSGIRPNAADLAEKQRHDKVVELIRKARTDASLWALCKERCWNVNKNGVGCCCGVEIPPDRDPERPLPPEQCYMFLGKGE
jgi:hypothetical protein